MSIQRIGFIGTGIMGSAMAGHLIDAGYELQVYNRTKEKAESLIARGAKWCESAGACARDVDVVITIVGYPKDVEETYLGADGIVNNAAEGTYIIDMTTSSPALAKRIYAEAKKKGLHAIDAPVTGGDFGAKAGTLTILVGGDEEDFNAVKPVFEAMGKNIVYYGEAGNGQHLKMCNQIALAGSLAGALEAIRYADAAGLDRKKMVETVATGAAGSVQLTNVAAKVIDTDYAPGFLMKHFIKDMNLADEEAKERGLTLDVLELVRDNCTDLEKKGFGEEGTQALYRHYLTK